MKRKKNFIEQLYWMLGVTVLLLSLLCVSCTEYTPKPRGYVRIEPDVPKYKSLRFEKLPYSFLISDQAVGELVSDGKGWVNISYPALNARIYCSYLPITPATLATVEQENRSLIERQSQQATAINEKDYSDPSRQVYGSLFVLDGEVVSPVQFLLTDSVSRFFRGALYYDCKLNADSLAPVTEYILGDIVELIQSFRWMNEK